MSLWLAMMCPRNRVKLVIVVGMDSQDTANLISLGSMLATVIAAIYTRRQAIGSKEAKAKADEAHKAALAMSAAAERSAKAAEERANQSEKLLEQMQKIASSLRGPVLELIKDPGYPYYILRNKTESSIKILKVLNHECFRYSDYSYELPIIPEEVHPGKPIKLCLHHKAFVTSLELRIKVSGKEETLFVEIPR